ncbi:MAG TPA: hypothetical protein VFU90_05485 [Candidatus Tumulicola sp.]|nr:hypothetical protein [Candidatus Tumulicola sp.]
MDALVKARFDLQHAAHDFGGHRVKALQATDAALEQLKICLEYDGQHRPRSIEAGRVSPAGRASTSRRVVLPA